MSDIKLTASFTLPGRVREGSDSYQNESVRTFNPITKHHEFVKFQTTVPTEAIQRINISQEAYDYWIETKTDEYSQNQWKKISDNYRVISHLKEIKQALGATSFKYHIF